MSSVVQHILRRYAANGNCIQEIIDLLNFLIEAGVSPGFMYNHFGPLTDLDYFLIGDNASNFAGHIVPVNGIITSVTSMQSTTSDYIFEVQRNDGGGTFTTMGAQYNHNNATRKQVFSRSDAVVAGDELAVQKISNLGGAGQRPRNANIVINILADVTP